MRVIDSRLNRLTSCMFKLSTLPEAEDLDSYRGSAFGLGRTIRPDLPVISATLLGPPNLSIISSKGLE